MEKKSKAETLRKKAELDTELEFLDAQKDLATAEAELRAIEEMDIDNLSRKSNSVVDSSERTRKFVEEVNQLHESALLDTDSEVLEHNLETTRAQNGQSTENTENATPKVSAKESNTPCSLLCEPASSTLNPEARPFEPQKDNLLNRVSCSKRT